MSHAMLDPNMLILAVLVGAVFLACGAFFIVRAVGRGRRKAAQKRVPYALPSQLLENAARVRRQEVRAALSEDSLRIADRLAALETGQLGPEEAGIVRHGLDAYALAGRLVDQEEPSQADLAGALVLMTIAGRDAARVEESHASPGTASQADPADLCVVDPTHGASVRHKRVQGVSIPVCSPCGRDITAGRRPQWLLEDGRPYVETGTVWARTLYGTTGGDLVVMIKKDLGR